MPAPGPLQIEASIAALHAQALSVDATDWRLNRAVAASRAAGPDTEARQDLARALSLARNAGEAAQLQQRLDALGV